MPAWAAPAATTITLAITSSGDTVASGGSVASGSVVTLTARVNAGTTAVTVGQVNFCDAAATYCSDIHLLGTAQLTSAGTAVLKFIPGIGSHSYKAVFVGTTSNAESASIGSALIVTGKYPTMTGIAQSGSGGDYSLMATVTGVGAVIPPTGMVSFLDASNGNSVLGTAMLGTGTPGLYWLNSQTPAIGNFPVSVAVGDFNRDGIPDLAVANGNDNTLTVLLGKGDGTFTTQAVSPATGVAPACIVVGDFNGDGIPDLAVSYLGNGPGGITILLGKGDGTFTTVAASPATGYAPYSIAVGDFNGDGIPDLAAANFESRTVTVLLGNGDGTFKAAASPATSGDPESIAVGDFNGDGKADLAVPNSFDNTVTILLGNGDGTFTTAASPITGDQPVCVVVGDFNGDGKADLAVANYNNGSYLDPSTLTILLGNGDGTFTAAAGVDRTALDRSLRQITRRRAERRAHPDARAGASRRARSRRRGLRGRLRRFARAYRRQLRASNGCHRPRSRHATHVFNAMRPFAHRDSGDPRLLSVPQVNVGGRQPRLYRRWNADSRGTGTRHRLPSAKPQIHCHQLQQGLHHDVRKGRLALGHFEQRRLGVCSRH